MGERAFEVITFDCYGTLVDWEKGIQDAFSHEAFRTMTTFNGPLIVELYHEVEPKLEAGPFRPYREILGAAARLVAERMNWSISDEGADFLARSLPDWPPFPDTAAALERLAAAGYRLGILSNVDDDLLAETRRNLPDVFDPELIVTAQQIGSYKPAPGHFEAARERVAGRSWLHAAASLFHDVGPATADGIATAWVNRGRHGRTPDDPSPGIEVPNLEALAERLEAGAVTG